MQAPITNYEADTLRWAQHVACMLSHAELVEELRSLKDAKRGVASEIARVMGIPTSRVADIFTEERTPRKITVDEMKALVEHFGLNGQSPPAEPEPPRLDPDTIAPLLAALLPAVDPDRLTDPVLRALSGAFAYGFELLGDQTANRASPDALAVAARGAVARFRELAPA